MRSEIYSVKWRFLWAFAVCIGGGAIPAHAGPVTIVSTFGSGSGFVAGAGSNVGTFPSAPQTQVELAESFTPTSSYLLNSISVAVANEFGPNQLTVYLATGSSQPGSPIESFSLTGLGNFATNMGGIVTATSILQPTLNAGQVYWVVLSASDLVDTNDVWLGVSAGGTVLPDLLRDFQNPTWNATTESGQAFAITGTQVTPEPSTATLCAILLSCMLGLFIQRRRARLS